MAAIAERLESIWGEKPGFLSFLSTVDHKKIGMKYLYTSLIFFVLGGIQALVMRVQLARANLEVLDPETYNQLFSMHGTTMMFLFIVPALSGFGNYIVPLMIGTRDMAFPRLNAFGYWTFAASGIFIYSSFLLGAMPNNGWFNYVPYASKEFNPGLNIDFYAIGLLFLGISSTAGAINLVVTILKQRAPGMSINRMPIFVWGELAFGLAIIFALPSFNVALLMLEFERKFGWTFFDATKGGEPLLWQHLFWIMGHPWVYILVLPAFGMVSMMLPVFSQRRIVGYTFVVLAEMATALLGFGVWVHHMFATGIPQISLAFTSAASFMVVLPSGVQFFAWLATLVAGKIRFTTAMMFTLGFLFLFLLGGFSGVMFASVPFDQQTTDSFFVVAHFHYVAVGASVFPMFGALYFWLPKITGRMLSEFWGHVSFWVMFVGFNLTFFPQHISGLLGQPRRTYTYQPEMGWDVYNLLSTIGAFLLTAGIAITFANWIWSRKHGRAAGRNPWNADTLEWATPSPPPEYNFETIPEIRSLHPVWDQPEVSEMPEGGSPPEKGGRPLIGHLTLSTSFVDATPQAIVHMPHETAIPFFFATMLTVMFYGWLFDVYLVMAIGGVLSIAAILAWFWPYWETQET